MTCGSPERRVAAGQQLAADLGVGLQIRAGQVLNRDGAFVVVELANQILPAPMCVQPRNGSV